MRASSQRLDAGVAGVVDAAHAVCGAQSQDAPAGALSLRARIDPAAGVKATDVERVRVEERAIVRTWLMRGTIHLVTVADLPLLLSLCGPLFARRSRPRRLQLGLDDATAERGVAVLCDALAAEGPLTREALRERLTRRGVPTEGQALVHLANLAALQGHICFGPGEGRRSTFVLLRDWLDTAAGRALAQPPPREEALATLARRYLDAFGPARPEDLAAWSGLAISDVRAGWQRVERDLVEVEVPPAAGQRAWLLASQAGRLAEVARDRPAERVALLAAWDTYLMGYRSREVTVGPEQVGRVVASGGVIYPTVTVDGRVVAIWRARSRRRQLTVTLEPLEPLGPLSAGVRHKVEEACQEVARFLDADEATLTDNDPTGGAGTARSPGAGRSAPPA